jgi:hypothetical protein
MRRIPIAIVACAVLATLPAAASASQVPKLPNSTHNAKRCGRTHNQFGKWRVFVTKGKHRISCRRASRVARGGIQQKGWQAFDWTKGGNGPWSDVWWRNDHRVIVAAILYDY